MHVLHRPHLPRLISVSIVAAILAIAVSLAFASAISSVNQPGNSTGPIAHQTAAPSATLITTAPRWVTSPFASLISRPLPAPWLPLRP